MSLKEESERRRDLRWIVAACLVLAATLALAVDTYRGGIEAGEEWPIFTASIAACLIAGFLVRSPWALLLAAAPPLIAAPLWLAPDAMGFLTWLALLYIASPAYLFFLSLGALVGAGHWTAAVAVTAAASVAVGVLVYTDQSPDDQRGADALERKIGRIDAARHGTPRRINCVRFSSGVDDEIPFRCDAFEPNNVFRYEVRVEQETGRFHVQARRNLPAAQGCCIEVE